MPRLFGTDGVRGVANEELTPEQVFRIGRAGAAYLAACASGTDLRDRRGRTVRASGKTKATGRQGRPFLVLGRDTRLSGDLLSAAVTAGCCSVGVDILDLGILPTPGVAYLTRRLGAAGGIVVSASHNPINDNGIKFFNAGGYKLSPEAEAEIEARVLAKKDRLPRPVGSGVGCRLDGRRHLRSYEDHLTRLAGPGLKGLKVVVDAAFGAAAGLATRVLRRAGAEVVPMNDLPDGSRINVECGSTHPEEMNARVRLEGAAVGLAFDGDADRVIASDENGRTVDGDEMLAILALDMMERDGLPGRTIVATVMSNLGLDLALRAAGGRVLRTPVGDRHVLKEMLEGGYLLGGEQSGHIIILTQNTTGDGLGAGISLLEVMARSGRPLSALASKVQKLPQVLVNVRAERKEKLETSEKVATAIERAREALGHTGHILVRPSGTEPVVRIMVEGRDEGRIREMARELAGVVAAELGGEVMED